jgi:hypothetical protein
MSRYIVVTRTVMIETELVEAKNKKEAFQKAIDGEVLQGQGEGESRELISTKKVKNGEEYFAYLGFEQLLEDDYDTVHKNFQNLPKVV